MTYRYLPFVRQGLASEITDIDDGSDLQNRASFPVTLRVAASATHTADRVLQVYGPGDVTGIDTQTILRTEPRRNTGNFAPNQFALIEFDPPDFPWMFTPARPGTNGRLRPWLVLIVVKKTTDVRVKPTSGRPLPEIDAPIAELPDLAESWAWAHAQMVEGDDPAGVAEELAAQPDLNVSRLMCPRRLQPDTSYLACVVPAFDAGRKAGLGIPVDEGDTTTGPAWNAGSAGTVTLPVYYHWDFATGPAGDFESLARKLKPMPLPDGVGSRSMFIGAADAAISALPPTPEDGGIIDLQGALRSPETGDPPTLTPEHDDFVADLTGLLDSGAKHLDIGVGASENAIAENVGPPIYGSWHVRQHDVPESGQNPKWLRELNTDPRHRAAGGLGTEVVKANQEQFMDAAWEQVGDVIAANQALNMAKLMDLITERLMHRHFEPLPEIELFSITTPMHAKTLLGDSVLHSVIAASTLPAEVADPGFRRMASPQNAVMKRAARLNATQVTVDGSVASTGVIEKLAGGDFEIELAMPLDGLVQTALIDRLPTAQGGEIALTAFGLSGTVPESSVQQVVTSANEFAAAEPGVPTIRPDIAIAGVFVDRHMERMVSAIGTEGSLAAATGEVLERRRADRDAVGFIVGAGDDAVRTLAVDDAGTLVARAGDGATRDVARLDAGVVRGGAFDRVATELGRLPLGTFDPDGSAPMVELDHILGDAEGDLFQPVPSGEPAITIEPPIVTPAVIEEFVAAYEVFEAGKVITFVPPALELIDVEQVGGTLIGEINPKPTIAGRVGTRVSVGGHHLLDLVANDRLTQSEPLAPILVGPRLDEPLYRFLAKYDQDRFLPGVGLIPGNAMTMVETNPEFVEAFLVGANHEMNRELRWRDYPTGRRSTVFHSFWDRLDGGEDIGPIHRFASNRRLGRNSVTTPGGSIVLLVRGDLLRRYPNSVIFATPATADKKLPRPLTDVHLPVFGGRLDPDITFAGFDLNVETVEPDPGYFFVIQEQPTEPRFGLDVPEGAGVGPPPTWSDLTWSHVGVDPGEVLSVGALGTDTNRRLAGSSGPTATWPRNAAHMAAITFQRPFRAAAHTTELLAGVRGTS